MNLRRLALCLSIIMRLATAGVAGLEASALTEKELSTTLEEQKLSNMEVAEGEVTKANVESGSKKNEKKQAKKPKKYTNAELRLMSAIIYCEANGEPYAGKKAVGIVVMNRIKSRQFPNTLKGVIYQRGQFGPVRNGSLNRALANYDAGRFKSPAAKQCIRAAKEALEGDTKIMIGGKGKNMSGYRFFSGRMKNARYRIGRHVFK
jgi:spore germination cell wall hydrolase CwlJ-like protein